MDTVIGRFVARRTLRGSVLWALLLGAYTASKSIGYVKAYPTLASREKLTASLAQNKGLEILVGTPRHVETVSGYIAWNCVQVLLIMGAIWGLMLVTKNLRGEEESGRWELLLSGSTTARGATLNVLAGIGASLVAFFGVLAAITLLVGHDPSVAVGARAILFFDLSIISGMVMFMLVGALASQLMPTRARAASLAAGVFGVSFLLRAVGDITSAHWILNFTPVGWVEKLQPLTGSQPVWLVPILALSALLLGATLWLAGQRDLEASTFADKSGGRPHTALLNWPLGLTLRISRTSWLSWSLGIGLLALFYSALTKTAVDALKSVAHAGPAVTRILHESSLASAKAYLGIVFLIMLLVLMSFAASLAGAIRREESNGYLDNLLVRPVSRWQWLGGRMVFGSAAVLIAGLVIAGAAWLGVASQRLDIPISNLLQAGINIAAAGILTFGAGVLAFGFKPRITSFAAYGVLVWSFLLNMLNSGLHLSHWLLDTSALNQLSLAPAVQPNWQVVIVMSVIGLLMMLIGATRFNHRDLQSE